jgi:diguanylate cyclase (GGDEF)-like protein
VEELDPRRLAGRSDGLLSLLSLPIPRYLLTLAALASLYFLAAKLGLAFALVNPSATAIWPPTGIALAAFLVLGLETWPAILLGAFLANLTTQGSIATSLCIGAGNTLEGIVGALLVNRFAQGRFFFLRPRDVVKFAVLAAIFSTTISATIGVATLGAAGLARPGVFGHIWLTWWLGDSAGDLVVAPALILWSSAPRQLWNTRRALEGLLLVLGLSLVALMVFEGFLKMAGFEHLPLEYLCVPFLFWAAFRIGRRGLAGCVLVLSFIAITGTVHGLGPFARNDPNVSLLMLQGYLAVIAVTMLAAAAVIWERRQMEEEARRLAVQDELTGLANYRAFMASLQSEIRRTERAGHAFAILLLDLDGLKKVNDRHGHLAGNRALIRMAECLRGACRVTDTPARFGGDEFAILLPETSEAGAAQLAQRITERLAADAELPPLSVSIGAAVYPRGGPGAEKLLAAADQELYRAKGRIRAQPALTERAPR